MKYNLIRAFGGYINGAYTPGAKIPKCFQVGDRRTKLGRGVWGHATQGQF